jgi:hypothetical protein
MTSYSDPFTFFYNDPWLASLLFFMAWFIVWTIVEIWAKEVKRR